MRQIAAKRKEQLRSMSRSTWKRLRENSTLESTAMKYLIGVKNRI